MISSIHAFDLFEQPDNSNENRLIECLRNMNLDAPTHTSTQVAQLQFFRLSNADQALEIQL